MVANATVSVERDPLLLACRHTGHSSVDLISETACMCRVGCWCCARRARRVRRAWCVRRARCAWLQRQIYEINIVI